MTDESAALHEEDLAPDEEAAEDVTGGRSSKHKKQPAKLRAEEAPCTDSGVAVDPFGGSGAFNL